MAAVLATVLVVGVGAFVLSGFLSGDTDRDGRVPVPGAETLTLSAGEVDVFYAEDVSLGDEESLTPPPDLALRVSTPSGDPLEIRSRGGQQVSGSGGTATLIASIDVPEQGGYEVVTRSQLAASRDVPEVTFGESPFDAVGDRVDDSLDLVLGPVGLGLIGLALLAALIAWARRRSSVESPTLPPDAGT